MTTPNSRGRWLSSLDEIPGLAFSGWILAVISLPLGFWFYQKSLDSRQLVIVEPSVRAVLIDKDTPATIEIRVGNRQVVNQDVYAIQLAVWNGGNRSIKVEHLLTPIVFVPAEGNTILDATVLRETRRLCGVKPHIRPTDGNVQVDLSILEPGDGAVIQLILAGKKESALGFKGTIEAGGDPRYRRIDAKQEKKSVAWSSGPDTWWKFIGACAGALFLLFGACLSFMDIFPDARKAKGKGRIIGMVLAFVVAGTQVSIAGYIAYYLAASTLTADRVPPSLQSVEAKD
jgi:hypothetical protein